MLKSMTGFGRSSTESDGNNFIIEIKSVNHRYFDLNIKIPRNLISFEDRIRKIVGEKISRGKVDVFITWNTYGNRDEVAHFNENIGDSYIKALTEIKSRYSLRDDISISLISKFPDVISLEHKEEDIEKIWECVNPVMKDAVNMLARMREVEGIKLQEDIAKRCDYIEELVHKISIRAPKLVEEYRQKLNIRLQELLNGVVIDESRLSQEVTIFADKVNIDEEIVRLKSHINQMRVTFNIEEPVGRKLDFLVQEMNREINTIGSKGNDLEIINMVLSIKNEIEKIREQVQNIE